MNGDAEMRTWTSQDGELLVAAVTRAFEVVRAIELAISRGQDCDSGKYELREVSDARSSVDLDLADRFVPKIHNAIWAGLVGKGAPGTEPFFSLESMLDLTANAEVNGVRFDGVDLFLYAPHIDIDISDDGIKRLTEKLYSKNLVVGSLVAPVWFDGSAMGDSTARSNWVTAVRNACRIGEKMREYGIRTYGVIRVDSAASVADWAKDPARNTKLIAKTFIEAASIASAYGEMLAAEGEICWGGMHSWREMVNLLEEINRPGVVGFQADMAHTFYYTLGLHSKQDALLPDRCDWSNRRLLDNALRVISRALRPWMIDFHVAQTDGSAKRVDKYDWAGKQCSVDNPDGILDIPYHAGFWLHDESEQVLPSVKHICWEACMLSNEVMKRRQTWKNILATMIATRDANSWTRRSG